MQHINSRTRAQIFELIGSFEFIRFSTFETDNGRKTLYTVRKPRGSKQHHFIGHTNGVITKCSR